MKPRKLPQNENLTETKGNQLSNSKPLPNSIPGDPRSTLTIEEHKIFLRLTYERKVIFLFFLFFSFFSFFFSILIY